MTLDQQITHAAARVAVAVSNGEEDQVAYWTAEVTRLMDQRDALEAEFASHAESMREWAEMSLHCATFDELKGSPDHSVVRHA